MNRLKRRVGYKVEITHVALSVEEINTIIETAEVQVARLKRMLVERPDFLPTFLSFMDWINRQIKREERCKVCDRSYPAKRA